jgi:hypothetical protein
MDDLSGPSSSSSSSISDRRSGCVGQYETVPLTHRVDRYDRQEQRRHVRRRSVPLSDQDGSSGPSSTSPAPVEGETRNRRRRKDVDDRQCKIQQVFFPPFEESSSSPSSGFVPSVDERIEGEKTTEGWARLLSPSAGVATTPPRSPRPGPRTGPGLAPYRCSMLNHRRTQSSTDIPIILAPTPRTPLRPSGFSLNQLEPPSRSQTTGPPLVMHVKPPNVSISPLTRSARKMLNVDDEESRGASPIEACPGGDGLVEVIKLDRLNSGRRGEGSVGVPQDDQKVSLRWRVGVSLYAC